MSRDYKFARGVCEDRCMKETVVYVYSVARQGLPSAFQSNTFYLKIKLIKFKRKPVRKERHTQFRPLPWRFRLVFTLSGESRQKHNKFQKAWKNTNKHQNTITRREEIIVTSLDGFLRKGSQILTLSRFIFTDVGPNPPSNCNLLVFILWNRLLNRNNVERF